MIPTKSLCLIAVCMPNYLPFFVVIVHGINKAYWGKIGPNFKMYLAKLPVQHLSKWAWLLPWNTEWAESHSACQNGPRKEILKLLLWTVEETGLPNSKDFSLVKGWNVHSHAWLWFWTCDLPHLIEGYRDNSTSFRILGIKKPWMGSLHEDPHISMLT